MKSILYFLLQDWQANIGTSLKSRFVLVLFRLAQRSQNWMFPTKLLRFIYQVIVEWVLGIDLPWDTQIGPNLQLQHGVALVVNHETTIGSNCILRHSTTIGNKKYADGRCSASPIIGDNVEIGSNVVILGPIKVGDNAIIGAGSVVVKDIPARTVVAGNPAKVIRVLDDTQSKVGTEEVTSIESMLSINSPDLAMSISP